MTIRNVATRYCNFCGNSQHDEEVERMVAGYQADICDKCVDICVEVIKEARQRKADGRSHPHD